MANPFNTPALEQLAAKLNQTHAAILPVHKALLDYEIARYQSIHGAVPSAGKILQLVINDPFFAWLRPLTALITQIDEYVESKEPVQPALGEALLAQSRTLLTPDEGATGFQREYFRCIQDSPEVAHTHGQWKLGLVVSG